jgi:3-(3-hydroxy-phenyl)propionate hydroxylase
VTQQRYDCDVLIVGLGPVGAVLATLLVRHGVTVIAVERDSEVYPLPRAVHFDHEIMRLFQALGVAEAVLAQARPVPDYEFRTADGGVLMRLPPAPQTPSGWASGYMFHQPSLEEELRELLAASPRADVRLGCSLERLKEDVDGVAADVVGPAGPTTIRTQYLIGCDGASSRVRQAMGSGLSDYAFDEPWLVVDVKAGPGARLPSVNLQICDPARPTTCVLGGPGRHRWEFMLLPGETPESMLREGAAEALIGPWDCGAVEIERRAVYRFHGLVADRWRAGRVLIAGDAAHQTPPFAGQGLCSGLRDAANLAWKLGAVLSGARDTLLDTYQPEREPHARALIELAIGMGRVVCTRDPEEAAIRDADMRARLDAGKSPMPHPRPPPLAAGCLLAGSPGAGTMFPQPCVDRATGVLRLDDVLGEGPWLIARRPEDVSAGVKVFGLNTSQVEPFQTALAAWLDAHSAEAVLVRPDRQVFGTGRPRDLLEAWAGWVASAEPAYLPVGDPA